MPFLGNKKCRNGCQCPTRAGLHFYTITMFSNTANEVGCQCPTRAGLPFYGNPKKAGEYLVTCVNALHGRDYISTTVEKIANDIFKTVSMPYTGGTTFLPRQTRSPSSMDGCVSMPYTGGTTFLPQRKARETRQPVKKCQCPTRAGLHFYPQNQD